MARPYWDASLYAEQMRDADPDATPYTWVKPCDWERASEHDKRIANGDAYAGDAWRNRETGAIKYTAVGKVPSCRKCKPQG